MFLGPLCYACPHATVFADVRISLSITRGYVDRWAFAMVPIGELV